jgi:hypothetical protein
VPKMRLVGPWIMGLLAGFAVIGARAQDLDAGKSGPQLYAQDCAACHRSPQGLARNLSGGSLVSFLRQHYTSSSSSAGAIAAYLQAAGGNARGDRQKGQASDEVRQRGQARERSKLGRQAPGEAAPTPPGSVPAAGEAAPARRQHERMARPTDATVERQGHPGRKSRRSRPTTPAPGPATPEAAPAAPAGASGGPTGSVSTPSTGLAPATGSAGTAADPSSAAAAVRSASPAASDGSRGAPNEPDVPKEPGRRAPASAAPPGFGEPLP